MKHLLSAYRDFCFQVVKNIHFTLEFHPLFLSTSNGNVRSLFIGNTGDCKCRPRISTVVPCWLRKKPFCYMLLMEELERSPDGFESEVLSTVCGVIWEVWSDELDVCIWYVSLRYCRVIGRRAGRHQTKLSISPAKPQQFWSDIYTTWSRDGGSSASPTNVFQFSTIISSWKARPTPAVYF